MTIDNCKETIIEAVTSDIAAGSKASQKLRQEVMELVETMSEQVERRHQKHVNKYEGFTL